jgi:dTDP-4-dehydrorhamnose 3,5-epimerase
MEFRELAVPGAWEVTPRVLDDERGSFLEWYRAPEFARTVGHDLDLRQANCSVSGAGVLRGIHVTDVPPGQAKYVFCPRGAIVDVVVDLRVGSASFGTWTAVVLDDVEHRALYLSEGLGHAFLSLEEGSTVVYLCSAQYAPAADHAVDALDPGLGIEWPTSGRDGRALHVSRSPKDASAPTLEEALRLGLLPSMDRVAALHAPS